MSALVDIREGEGRAVGAAFASLFGITAAHTLLETARDALFLAKLPATRLAWVYLAVAAIGVAASWVNRRRAARSRAKSALPLALLGAAAVNVGLWILLAHPSATLLYALYAWSAIFASWVVVELWLLLGAIFTVGMAKRLYGFVGAGAVLGAVSGAAAARALAGAVSARHLIVAASALLVATAVGPAMALKLPASPVEPEGEAPGPRAVAGEQVRAGVFRDPYVRRVLALVLISTITFTAVDYLFKASVARRVPAAELGSYFASVYLVLNAAALVVQVAVVGWALRTLGVHRVVWAVPLFLGAGAASVIAGGGLVAALLLKGADGALRHSVHRTSVELLFVPMPDAARARAKPLIDLVGQRGGQAIASVALLALAALGGGEVAVAAVIAALAAGWVAIAAGVRGPYLDLFRATLRAGRVDTRGELPDLDLGALETLFAAFNSKKDAEVIGALDLLAALGRSRLIPALILFHPSKAIVLHAFTLLPREGRADFVPVAERLLDHPDAEVRAAAFRARVSALPDVAFLRQYLQSPRAELRATALVSLVARGHLRGEEAEASLLAVATADPPEAAALARAIAFEPSPAFEATLLSLIARPEPGVQVEAATAMGSIPALAFLPALVERLPLRDVGAAARGALVELGAPALAYLDRALEDTSLSREVRWTLPRAVSAFEPSVAGPVLLRHLGTVPEGVLRYRLLRGLVRARRLDPRLRLDYAPIDAVLDRALHAAFDHLGQRTVLVAAADDEPRRRTPAFELLVTLLRDKHDHAIDRAFAALGLLYPNEDFDRIRRGLASPDPRVRASSRELVQLVVAAPGRDALLVLLEELPDAERLARAPSAFAPVPTDAAGALRAFLGQSGELRALAEVHAGEIGILRPSQVPARNEDDDDGALVQGVASLRGWQLAMASRGDLTARALHLRSIPVTAELEPRVVHVIAAALREQVFDAGAYLMREGEPPPAFHLILDGSAKVVRSGKDFGRLVAPQGVSFVSVLAGGDAPYDAIAEVDTTVLTLEREALFDLMEDHPSLLVAILRYASQRLYHEVRELSAEALAIPFGTATRVGERPLDLVERILFLRTLTVFCRTNLNALAELSRALEEIRVPAGGEIFHEGDPDAGWSYWIVTGTVRCDASVGARTFRYGPSTIVGGIESIAGTPRWYTATAETPLVALRGYAHGFIEMMEDDFPTAKTFVATMTTNLQEILVAKGAEGLLPFGAPREMERLGAVPVGV